MGTSVSLIWNLIMQKPYRDNMQNTIESLNEITLGVSSYSFLLFTDFNINAALKEVVGWCLIGAIVLNIVLNYFTLLYINAKDIVNFIRQCKKKKKIKML